MSQRSKGCLVTFTEDVHPDEVEAVLNAIRMVKRVASVSPLVSDHIDFLARERVRHEIRGKLFAAMDQAFRPNSLDP